MKLIANCKTANENLEHLGDIIDDIIDKIELDSERNIKKRNEVFHVGKFLMIYQNNFKIKELLEGPDFIISNNQEEVGLEHQIVIHEESRETEGFYANICSLAEEKLRTNFSKELPLFLATIYFNPIKNRKQNQKKFLVDETIRIIEHYLRTKELVDNDLIFHLHTMPHTRISLSANLGAWSQRRIGPEKIKDAIMKKEQKFHDYYRKTSLKQWLLLVIGGVGDSSFNVDADFEIDISTNFEKVFLYEDQYDRLYAIK